MHRASLTIAFGWFLWLPVARAQDAAPDERWNLFWQATSIGQSHGAFPAAYSGPLSLADHPEKEVSLTTTLFLGLRLDSNTAIYVDPEMAGGRGFSGVNGMANSPNGEMPRVETATPKPMPPPPPITNADLPFRSTGHFLS